VLNNRNNIDELTYVFSCTTINYVIKIMAKHIALPFF
jgi:hypothetical protein